MTHIYVSKLTIIGSDNGLSQAGANAPHFRIYICILQSMNMCFDNAEISSEVNLELKPMGIERFF